MAMMLSQSQKGVEIGEKWEVEYSRFFHFPSSSSSISSSSSSRLTDTYRSRLRGTWLSSSPSSLPASLKLSADFHNSNFILSLDFLGTQLEEHYISRLNFTWPHVSCMSGFPPRGSRAVMISYKDHLVQIQKFALRFSATSDTEAFMATVKELMEFPKNFRNKSSDKLASEISSQSDFVSSEEVAYRPLEDWSTAVNTFKSIDQLESSFNSEFAQEPVLSQSTVLNHNAGNILGVFPPSFMSLMTMSTQALKEATPSLCSQADIKLQLMRHLDNSSFQDIMGKVEEIMSQKGNNMLL